MSTDDHRADADDASGLADDIARAGQVDHGIVRGGQVEVGGVQPDATDEEMAAVLAAIEMSWPRAGSPPPPDPPMRWRFSGRWWSKPIPSRRDRPS